MDHKERFLKALKLEQTDKLSHGDQMIHDELVAQITKQPLPGDEGNALARWMGEAMSDENYLRHKKARAFLGLDWVQVFPREAEAERETTQGGVRFKDLWGAVHIVSKESSCIVEKPIRDETCIVKYEFPDVNDFDYCNIKRWIDDGEFAVAAQIDTGFFKISQLTGFEEYMSYIIENKSEMHTLMEKFVEFQKKMVDHLIGMGVDVIWLSDDNCFNSGPFTSPESMWEFDFQYMKRIVEHIHSRNTLCVLHCCGNINYTIKYMVETGINGIHSLQPSAGNDIYAYKREYGKDVCLIGNIDINQLMPKGSPFEIDQKVKEMVDKLYFDRRGWILATTNLLGVDSPVENVITLHLAAEKYGR